MKKFLALILTLALICSAGILSVAVAETADPEPFTIGIPWSTSNPDPTWVSITNIITAAVEAAGGTPIFVETDLTADGLINNVTELISRDVDGILFMPASDSMLPAVDALCSEAGVYWGTFFRTISDDAIREAVYASEWYAGACYEDDEACAANLVKTMADMGVTNLGVVNIAKGDTSSDLRDAGTVRGAEENGVTILNTTYGITVTTDMTKTIESYIAAYPEMDGVLLLGTYCADATATILKSLSDHDLAGKVKYGRIDCEAGMGDYIDQDMLHVVYGCQQQIDPLIGAVILVNKVIGTPIVEDGPTVIITPYLPVTTSQEAADFTTYFLDSNIYNPDEIAETMIKFYNSDVNLDYMNELLANFSIEEVKTRHAQ